MVLEADEVVAIGAEVFLAELHDGPGRLAGARIAQAHGLHGAEAQRVRAAAGEDFGGEGLRTAQVLFIHDKRIPLLGASIVQALMVLLVGLVLVFLFDAARARGATTPRVARLLAMLGAVAGAVSREGVKLEGAESVGISFPGFFELLDSASR